MKVIGIDIGTTSICGVVLNAVDGKVLASQTINSDAFISTQNEWEKVQDVDKIIAIATGILNDFLAQFAGEIVGIGLTGQMHGIVYFDKFGKAVSPLFTWQDARGNLPYQGTTYAAHLGSFSGYGNVTDFYNRQNGLVPDNAAGYCTIQDYLGMVICGNKQAIIHTSNAASLGLFDVNACKFDYPCNAQITDKFEIIGHFQGIPVSVAIGDNQASVFATLADENDVLINVGTGSQVSVVSSAAVSANGIESRPYVDGKFIVAGSALCGGRSYAVLKSLFEGVLTQAGCKDVDVYAVMDKMLCGKTDTTLKVDTRFAGTRADATARGSITNISTDNLTPPDLAFGVLKGMIQELFDMYCLMNKTHGGIVGSGNGIRKNKVLAQIAERVFGGKLRIPTYTEEAACGAALFALVASKNKTLDDVRALIKYE